MIYYFFTDEEGLIISSGYVSDEDNLPVNTNATRYLEQVPAGMNYYRNGVFSFIKSIEEYTREALQKRDIFLREGPDRISPVWWSSMTTEEQKAWTDYRQALLDITEQPNYPQEIVWPTKP
jgi:Phage tail assembly chaperone protein